MRKTSLLLMLTLGLHAADSSSDVLTIQPTGQTVIKGTAPASAPLATANEVDIGGGTVMASGAVTAIGGAQVGTANSIQHQCGGATRTYGLISMSSTDGSTSTLANALVEGDVVSKNNVMAGGKLCATGVVQANGDINTWSTLNANAGVNIGGLANNASGVTPIKATVGTGASAVTKSIPIPVDTAGASNYSIVTKGGVGSTGDVVSMGNVMANGNVYANGLTVAGATTVAAVTASGLITANSGVNLGATQTLKVDTIAPASVGETSMSAVKASGLITANSGVTLGATKTLKVDTIAPASAGETSMSAVKASGLVTANAGLTTTTLTASGATSTVMLTASGLITASAGLKVPYGNTTSVDILNASGPIAANDALNVSSKGIKVMAGDIAVRDSYNSQDIAKISSTGEIMAGKLLTAKNGILIDSGDLKVNNGNVYALNMPGKGCYICGSIFDNTKNILESEVVNYHNDSEHYYYYIYDCISAINLYPGVGVHNNDYLDEKDAGTQSYKVKKAGLYSIYVRSHMLVHGWNGFEYFGIRLQKSTDGGTTFVSHSEDIGSAWPDTYYDRELDVAIHLNVNDRVRIVMNATIPWLKGVRFTLQQSRIKLRCEVED